MTYLFKVLDEAMRHPFKSAAGIVDDVMVDAKLSGTRGFPHSANLIRQANRLRQIQRPKHPTTKDFEVSTKFINAFGNTNINVIVFVLTKYAKIAYILI